MMVVLDRFWDAYFWCLFEWCEGGEGLCVVFWLKLGKSWWGMWLVGYFWDFYYCIWFDKVGTFVWKVCDG